MAAFLLDDVVRHLDQTLETHLYRDYGPNGLQVEAGRGREVARVVTGVSANLALIAAAAERGADLLVVHHGLIWGAGLERVVGAAARRLAALLGSGISLAAYHLPLDRHPRLGNNAGMADALGLPAARRGFGVVRGHELGLAADLEVPMARAELLARVGALAGVGEAPPFTFPHGADPVRRVGLCTGAASDLLEEAAAAGCDLFVTGELAERAGELARELGITLVAAGHHATEVFGPRRLADELTSAFPGIDAEFVDVPSPL
jgi:dinuclear metal center YbgI/SA1388 family protein